MKLGWVCAAAACAVAGCGGQSRIERSPFHSGANNAILRVRTNCRAVALTFDDGPLPSATPRLLRTLAAHHAVATFFDLGERARARPDLIARELAGGDQVGDHTYDHARLPLLGGSRLAAEFSRARGALKAAGARSIRLFRPPFGDFDGRVQAAAAARGETLIGWDLVLAPRDPMRTVALVAAAARPGSIILAHDFDERFVGALLDRLRARGLNTVTVSRLLSRAVCGAAGRP